MATKFIKLPAPNTKGKISVEEAISRRRSVRRYKNELLTIMQLSQILWSAQGITDLDRYRAAPSAGATYPLEIFILVGKGTIEGLEAGIYHYDVNSHSLNLHKQGDFRVDLAQAALAEGFISVAPMDIVVCALYPRTSYRYGKRGERYVHMEVGHVGQNVHLQAVALGLGTVMVGAFNDEEVSKVLDVEEAIKPLYIMPVGKPV